LKKVKVFLKKVRVFLKKVRPFFNAASSNNFCTPIHLFSGVGWGAFSSSFHLTRFITKVEAVTPQLLSLALDSQSVGHTLQNVIFIAQKRGM
jgi:hypothetical protein